MIRWAAATLLLVPADALANPLRQFDDLVVAPDGRHVASVEQDVPAHDGDEPIRTLVIRAVPQGAAITVGLPCGSAVDCRPASPAFAPDGKTLAFVLGEPHDPKRHLFTVATEGGVPVERLAFTGTIGSLRYAPDGTLAMLAVAGAHKEVGAVKAGAPLEGEIGVDQDEQRIAVLDGDRLDFVSPADRFVYEYDWRPDASGFVGTAAPGNGDDAWWTAKLWSFPRHGAPSLLYAPPPRQQLALPVVSPDGDSVAFVGGIMSDFGSTGGDAFRLKLDGKSRPVDLTPAMRATVTGLDWHCPGGALIATALRGSNAQLLRLDAPSANPKVEWSGEETIGTGGWNASIACGGGTQTLVHESFTAPPEIETATSGDWHDLTSVNRGATAPVAARSLTWHSDGFDVQGWLLQPTDRTDNDNDNQAMITDVHGGPAAASTPHFPTDRHALWLLRAGYDVFLPNPRGSFGQGEAFTEANVRDFGHGDLRDILRGVDRALDVAPIDPGRLGLMGYSYGGYMTMWAVTQTDRFKAAVAGAGVSDWQSYYGENGIDGWLLPYFGASVYDDPAIYAKSSPIDFVRNVHTPTFEFVGDRDIECPLPQTQEFWHALRAMGVPTEFVVYPGQGHDLHDPADQADVKQRALAWFARYLDGKPPR